MKTQMDGGGFPMFESYHDYVLQLKDLKARTRHTDERAAFEDFKQALRKDPNWRRRFTLEQATAIDRALTTNNPVIDGFTWHHHQDRTGEVMRLVDRNVHIHTGHWGGWAISRR